MIGESRSGEFRPSILINSLGISTSLTLYHVSSAGRGARMSDPPIFISAGEASGEHYGALLIDELRVQLAVDGQQASFVGMGGQRMVEAGLDQIVRSEDMAVMGITEVIRHLPRIYREYRKLKAAIQTHRPNIAILID